MENFSNGCHSNPSSLPPTIFLSKIPQKVSHRQLYSFFHRRMNIQDFVHFKICSKSRDMPKIGIVQVLRRSDFDLVINSSPLVLKCGSEIQAERQLSGEELDRKQEEVQQKRISLMGIYGRVTNDLLREKFERFGEVDVAYCRRYKDNRHKAYGFVTFFDKNSALRALAAKKIKINSKNVRIQEFAKKNKEKQFLGKNREVKAKKSCKKSRGGNLKVSPKLPKARVVDEQGNRNSKRKREALFSRAENPILITENVPFYHQDYVVNPRDREDRCNAPQRIQDDRGEREYQINHRDTSTWSLINRNPCSVSRVKLRMSQARARILTYKGKEGMIEIARRIDQNHRESNLQFRRINFKHLNQ